MLTALALTNAPILRAIAAKPIECGQATAFAGQFGREQSNMRKTLVALTTEGLILDAAAGAGRGIMYRLSDAGLAACAALDRADGIVGVPDGFADLRHDQIDPDPDNARKDFDPVELAALAASLADKGLMQKPGVRLVADLLDPHASRYQLVFGERRWRAWGINIAEGRWPADHVERLPILTIEDEVAAAEASLIENEQRANLNHVERGEAYANLARLGRSTAEIARVAGRTPEYVQQHRRLIKLDPIILDQVRAKALTFHEAMKLAPTTRKANAAKKPAEPPLPLGDGVVGSIVRELDERLRFLAAVTPLDAAGRLERAREATLAYDAAIIAGDLQAASSAGVAFRAVGIANNGGQGGCAGPIGDLLDALAAPDGDVPIWGQKGQFLIEVGGVRMEIEADGFGGSGGGGFNISAVDPDAPFPSDTGFRAFCAIETDGRFIEAVARDLTRHMTSKAGKPGDLVGEQARACAAKRGAATEGWPVHPLLTISVGEGVTMIDSVLVDGVQVGGNAPSIMTPTEARADRIASTKSGSTGPFIGDDFSRQVRAAAEAAQEDEVATAEAEVEAAAEIGGMIAGGLFAEWNLAGELPADPSPDDEPRLTLTLTLSKAQAAALAEVVGRPDVAA